MKNLTIGTMICASFLTMSCANPAQESDNIEADPNDFAHLSCEELQLESVKRAKIIVDSDKDASNASKANTAGVATGIFFSPLLGAAIAAGSQAKKSEYVRTAQQASVDKQAIDIMAKSKDCW